MKHLNSVLGFAAGCATAALVSRLAVDLNAQDPGEQSIHVCVASGNVLQLAAPVATCEPGQNSLYFKKVDPSANGKDASGSKDAAINKERLADLERRLKALEDSAADGKLANRVVAPFEVVDRAGKRIFYVDEEAPQVQVYNGSGKPVARVSASENGGHFTGESATNALQATIGAVGAKASVLVLEGGVNRIDLGRDESAGTYRLKILGQKGALVAGLGQNRNIGAGGALFVANEAGDPRVSMSLDRNGKGALQIEGSKTVLASLAEGATGGGRLLILSSTGQPMVEAGVEADGYGVVRAGPESFKPGLGFFGLPGSYLTGKPK